MKVHFLTIAACLFDLGVELILTVDDVMQINPLYRMQRAAILDTMFGPAQDLQSVTTPPPSPPL